MRANPESKSSFAGFSTLEARQITLAAQGFAVPRPAQVSIPELYGVVERLGVVQIDSVNVLCRAHYMPFFSRLGAYSQNLLDQLLGAEDRRPGTAGSEAQKQQLFEYWAHEASIIPASTRRLLNWRMSGWGNGQSRRDQWAADHPEVLEAVTAQVKAQGPLTVRQMQESNQGQFEKPGAKRNWWGNWPPEKMAAELLFARGVITSAGRSSQFERRFVLPEQVLPPEIIAAADPGEPESVIQLVEIAARACGVATERDLRDYFRLSREQTVRGIAALVEREKLLPVTVEGVRGQTWLYHRAPQPQPIAARALLAPFDPLIWERSRLRELFGIHYRIEIYTPQPQRRYGYYVLPFLLGDQIVARVDLKADRQARLLRVPASYLEPQSTAPVELVAAELAAELIQMSSWLGLDGVEVADVGDLASALRSTMVNVAGSTS